MYCMLEATSVKEINTGEGDKIIKVTAKSVARYIKRDNLYFKLSHFSYAL